MRYLSYEHELNDTDIIVKYDGEHPVWRIIVRLVKYTDVAY